MPIGSFRVDFDGLRVHCETGTGRSVRVVRVESLDDDDDGDDG